MKAAAAFGSAIALLASLALWAPAAERSNAAATSAAAPSGKLALPRRSMTRVPLSPKALQRFAIATAPYAFHFPRDHGAHPDYRSEWWYFTGHVRTKTGRRFGYELTFFRFGLKPGDPRPAAAQSRWRGHELYPAHFALTDERGRTFFHTDRFAREAIGMGGAVIGALDVHAGDWSLRGMRSTKPNFERMSLHARAMVADEVNAIDFVQVPEKPPAVHGRGGISRKAACESCASHYYSYTRLRTTGTLTYRGVALAITGLSWMDHEYGSDELQRDQAGWDWFSLQLDDGRDLMLYLLRQRDGSVTAESSGSLIQPDGTVRHLERNEFAIAQTGSWKSPHTAAVYPSGWRVQVKGLRIDLVLAPTVADQELAGTTTGVSYWEGAVDVRDASAAKTTGVGYVELTGYAGTIRL